MTAQKRYVIVFSTKDEPGHLLQVLGVFADAKINLKKIESRKNYSSDCQADIYIEFWHLFDPSMAYATFEKLLDVLRPLTTNLECVFQGPAPLTEPDAQVPWFPRNIHDLDAFATRVLEFGEALDADHPGFLDPEYRARRLEIVQIAKTYQSGQPIPRIQYSEVETSTWRTVFNKLRALYPSHACREYLDGIARLQSAGLYGPDAIPQLEDVSRFLQQTSGFSLKPVMGLLSSRDFLNGLAFRVFHSTQYIRHPSKPLYTPEPDVCHELLGHVPLFCNRDFAAFSQEIGLASLGASDDEIKHLASIYWFTIEFGLTEEAVDDGHGCNKVTRAYGAGLLSSFGELEYSLTDPAVKRLAFEPHLAATTEYPITSYQPLYYVAPSFKDAQAKIKAYADSLQRPFTLRYDPYTKSVIVLDRKEKIRSYAYELSTEFQNLLKSIE